MSEELYKCLTEPDAEERKYRALWRLFYDTIEVEGRHNPADAGASSGGAAQADKFLCRACEIFILMINYGKLPFQ